MANAETIKQVESIILADDTRRYIVVSAPGKREREDAKVTDLLYRLKRVFDEGSNYKEVLSLLQDRFFEICRGLEVDIDVQAELDDLMSFYFLQPEYFRFGVELVWQQIPADHSLDNFRYIAYLIFIIF